MYFWFYLSFIIYVWHYLFSLKSSKLDKGLENFKEVEIVWRNCVTKLCDENCVTKIPVFFFRLDCISSKCLCSSSFLSFLWKVNCPAKLFNHIKCGKIKQISNCLAFLVPYLHTLLAIEKYNVDKVFLITSRLFRKVAYTTIKWFSILSLEYDNPHKTHISNQLWHHTYKIYVTNND